MDRALTVARVLLGIFLVVNAGVGFVIPLSDLPMSPAFRQVLLTLYALGPLMPLVKGTELVVGFLLATGTYVPLALVLHAPVLANILLLHAYFEPGAFVLSIPMAVVWAFLVREHWSSFAPLFVRRPTR